MVSALSRVPSSEPPLEASGPDGWTLSSAPHPPVIRMYVTPGPGSGLVLAFQAEYVVTAGGSCGWDGRRGDGETPTVPPSGPGDPALEALVRVVTCMRPDKPPLPRRGGS
jgi:hypothetical protein